MFSNIDIGKSFVSHSSEMSSSLFFGKSKIQNMQTCIITDYRVNETAHSKFNW